MTKTSVTMLWPHMACSLSPFYWPDGWVGREKEVRDISALVEKRRTNHPFGESVFHRSAAPVRLLRPCHDRPRSRSTGEHVMNSKERVGLQHALLGILAHLI